MLCAYVFGSYARHEADSKSDLDAITEIENYTSNQAFPEFLNNSMMRFACIKTTQNYW
ncbi:nucleotidyltransferase domain-containing protein [Spirosoma sp. SC4-14]|uniref:nucleotidyltransferase domain-containing protein n=1 Tax=Spirosoma sp. SC4-14 TaxID=3128900 RepID=UPI0030CE22A5